MTTYSILMLSWNRLPQLQACLWSLRKTWETYADQIELLILDNGSGRPQIDWLRKYAEGRPYVKLILATRNQGVAGGRDHLLQQAQNEIVIFLDGDITVVDHRWLHRLTDPLKDEQIGICGPAGHWIVNNWRGFMPLAPSAPQVCDCVSGYTQAFRRSILDTGVQLDQFYNPYWHEDTDFCLQIAERGMAVWHTGYIGLSHLYAGSGDDGRHLEKMAYMAAKFKGKKLIRAERE